MPKITINYRMKADITAPSVEAAIDKFKTLRLDRQYKSGNTECNLEFVEVIDIEDEDGEEIMDKDDDLWRQALEEMKG